MTDDEIDAILRPVLMRHYRANSTPDTIWSNEPLCIPEPQRIAFRAGMLKAAEIARERQLPCAAAAIERAAGGEG